MTTSEHRADPPTWDELRSAWSLYSSAIEVWLERASDPGASIAAGVDVDHLIHAAVAAHNSWSNAFVRMIETTHHH
jgi:hypothetical protein